MESAILVATKAPAPKGHKLRVVALENEDAVAGFTRAALLDAMGLRLRGRQGRKGGIHVHDVTQSQLRADIPWAIKHTARDLPSVVVGRLEHALADGEIPVERLGVSWRPFMGIQTAADSYSKKIQRRLTPNAQAVLESRGHRLGDPIYSVPPGDERLPPWKDNPSVLVRSPEPEGVLYGVVDDEDYVNLVRVTADSPPPSSVLDYAESWRPVLQARAGFAEFPSRAWWETHRARTRDDLIAPKVIALHRTDRGRFALDERGRWAPSGRMCVIVGRTGDAPVAYLCGILNSELIDLWYSMRGRVPRDIWRDYEPKPLNEVPYRRPDGDTGADEVAELVRAIGGNRQALLPAALAFRRGGKETGRVTGEDRRLDLLQEMIGMHQIDDATKLLLPKDMDAFDRAVAALTATVQGLLQDGSTMVEQVEHLVCGLYGLTDELTQEVIAHARRRAGSNTPRE